MTCIVPVLLYGSKTWTLLSSDSSCLEAFHMRCQRQILRVKWQDMIRNTAITEKTGLPSVTAVIDARPMCCLAISQDSTTCTNSKQAAPCYRRSLRHAPVTVLEATLWPHSWHVAQTVPSLQHSHQGALGCCCWMWSWCFDATFLAEYATMMMMIYLYIDKCYEKLTCRSSPRIFASRICLTVKYFRLFRTRPFLMRVEPFRLQVESVKVVLSVAELMTLGVSSIRPIATICSSKSPVSYWSQRTRNCFALFWNIS